MYHRILEQPSDELVSVTFFLFYIGALGHPSEAFFDGFEGLLLSGWENGR